MGEISDIQRGGSPRPINEYLTDASDGINWIKIGDTEQGGKYIYATAEKIKPAGASRTRLVFPNDLLLTNSMSFGRPYICKIKGAIHDGWLKLSFDNKHLDIEYLYHVLSSALVFEQFVQKASGTGVKNLKVEKAQTTLLPLPPSGEQKRIVKILEEVLPMVTLYEKQKQELEVLHNSLPYSLRKSIIQEAIQGKLVPQDETDEPASVLLERIAVERAKLGKKTAKPMSCIVRRGSETYEVSPDGTEKDISDEIPFEIPAIWKWVRLGEIFSHNTGKALNSSNASGEYREYITTSNLYWNYFKLENLKEMRFTDDEIEKCTALKGDLLICEGGDIGRAAIWTYDAPICLQNHIHRLRSYCKIETMFFYYIFRFYKDFGYIGGKGIGIQGLSSRALDKIFMPVPPLAEQHRIVEKLGALLSQI